jgi:cell division protein FtsI (penicillin-binding protein 3)
MRKRGEAEAAAVRGRFGKLPSRLGVVHMALALFFVAIVIQSARVQLINGRAWQRRADRQQVRERDIPAPRGRILDETGRVMAQNNDKVRLDITPREVRERAKLEAILRRVNVPPQTIARSRDTSLKNVTIPGTFLRIDVARALNMKGVHVTPFVERAYSASRAARQIIGRVGIDGRPTDGIELSLDHLLKGKPGLATLVQNVRRQTFESPTEPGIAPVEGNTVMLTINQELQEIAENALANAVSEMGATSGDIVVLDPHSGEIRAMASRRGDSAVTTAAITEPFEPGSTLKPFVAAGLMQRGLVQSTDSVDTGDGILEIHGRTITDDHKLGRVPLTDVIRMSSNVGIVQFAQRLTPRDHFETLRDFGLGTPTGIEFPSEAAGTLRTPRQWGQQSAASMSIGYEIAVTPLQLALGYAVFANGGHLLEPTLVKEVRSPDGSVQYRHKPRVVRRVISEDVAAGMREMLKEVVRSGTATEADIGEYVLAGKTGTPRGMVDGRYASGLYNPNFVSLFPADDPQFVIVVRLSNPNGSYYGGKTAAPVTRAIIEAAVASPRAALDRRRLAATRKETAPQPAAVQHVTQLEITNAAEQAGELRPLDTAETTQPSAEPVVVTLPAGSARPVGGAPRVVPDVRGMSLRDAVRTLHSAGFRVGYSGRGGGRISTATFPAAGSVVRQGSLIRLVQ